MAALGSICDDYYVNMNLATEMDLPKNRETLLHHFEQIQKQYPQLKNFYSREKTEFVLEEEKTSGAYRWTSVENRRINGGSVNPDCIQDAVNQHQFVLEMVPFTLSVSALDCESLSVVFGFDFAYRGNHFDLLAEALGITPALEPMTRIEGTRILGGEPAIQLALDDECRVQCRVSFEPRTAAYAVRTGEYGEEQLSVYLALRRFESIPDGRSFSEEFGSLAEMGEELVHSYLVPNVLQPLQQVIAIR